MYTCFFYGQSHKVCSHYICGICCINFSDKSASGRNGQVQDQSALKVSLLFWIIRWYVCDDTWIMGCKEEGHGFFQIWTFPEFLWILSCSYIICFYAVFFLLQTPVSLTTAWFADISRWYILFLHLMYNFTHWFMLINFYLHVMKNLTYWFKLLWLIKLG